MARLDYQGAEDLDLPVLSPALGRRAGSGEPASGPSGDLYGWTTPGGLSAQAGAGPGAFATDPLGAPSGQAARVELELGGAGGRLRLTAEGASAPGFGLERLAALAPPEAGFAPMLSGNDSLTVSGDGDARLFGDAVQAAQGAEGGADRFAGAGGGGRQAAGDFWTVPASVATAAGGADAFLPTTSGPLRLWGDAVRMSARPAPDGALFAGGDDLIDARGAAEGAPGRAAALFGDVGFVGGNREMTGGDDRIRGPSGDAGLVGDAFDAGLGARLRGGDDRLVGGGGDDRIIGDLVTLQGGATLRPGADRLRGRAGDDILHGDLRDRSEGARIEDGRGGADLLKGGRGADILFGGPGADRLAGGRGPDRLLGQGGRDSLSGGRGEDWLAGGRGADALAGGRRADALRGKAGADTLLGEAGRDLLKGGRGRDVLEGGPGRDALIGGRGADVFVFRPGDGRDVIRDLDPGRDALRAEDGLPDFALRARGVDARLVSDEVKVLIEGVTADALRQEDPDWLA